VILSEESLVCAFVFAAIGMAGVFGYAS
jgi:hypothetical protein